MNLGQQKIEVSQRAILSLLLTPQCSFQTRSSRTRHLQSLHTRGTRVVVAVGQILTGVVPWVVIKVEVAWTTVYTLFFNEGKTCKKYLYLEIKKRCRLGTYQTKNIYIGFSASVLSKIKQQLLKMVRGCIDFKIY